MQKHNSYNPDVLSCLANLSSDEVFTPPALANAILDLLPATLWSDTNATFLDPVCKSGVFLRELAKRLDVGLEKTIPDKQQRLNHIFSEQLYGVAITEITALLSRRSVYCSKMANGKYSVCDAFSDSQGHIRFDRVMHTWDGGHCLFCGASQANYERGQELEAHAYQFIHVEKPEEVFKMKFDVIVGNPPYQMNDGGGTGSSARPIYHMFIQQAKKLNPRYLSMIVPSRWFTGGKGLDDFRREMLADDRIRRIVDYSDSRECFPGVDIAGGVNYFLWERDYHGPCEFTNIHGSSRDTANRPLNELDTLVRHSITLSVVRKAKKHPAQCFLSECVSSRKPFGLDSKVRPKKSGSLTIVTSNGTGPYPINDLPDGQQLIDKWKVFLSKASSDHGGQADVAGLRKVFARVLLAGPSLVCTESYLVIGPYPNERQAKNAVAYLKTKTVRYLVAASLFTQNITKDRFDFVPSLPMTKKWSDEDLYKELGLAPDEVAHIESCIRPWEDD
jgi:site-specific DNA-methyltransferase (adenine-specific)